MEELRLKMLLKRKSRLESYFRSVLDSFPIPFLTVDIDEHILRVNPSMELLVNRKQHELVGLLVTENVKLPNNWIKQEKKIFKSVMFGYNAVVSLQEENGKHIGYIVALVTEREISFQPNW